MKKFLALGVQRRHPGFSFMAHAQKAAVAALLGAGSLLMGTQGAIAAETVILELSSGELTITIDELEAFATTGELSPEVQEFFDVNRQDAPNLQRLVSEEVVVGSDIENFLETSTGEFVLLQLDQLVSRSPNEATLEALRTALRSSYESDGRFSILEIAQVYPESEIYLDLRGLETVYGDVKTFVERIRPALEAAKQYLQELICECETATPTPAVESDESPVESEPEAVESESEVENETEAEDDTSSYVPLSAPHASTTRRECVDTPAATEVQDAETTISTEFPASTL